MPENYVKKKKKPSQMCKLCYSFPINFIWRYILSFNGATTLIKRYLETQIYEIPAITQVSASSVAFALSVNGGHV